MDTKELTTEFERILDSRLGKKSEFSQESVASMATVITVSYTHLRAHET